MDTANCRQSNECFDDIKIPVTDALISKRIFCTDNFVKNGKACKKLSATNKKKCVKRKGSKVKTDPSKRCKSGIPETCSSESLQTFDGADKTNVKDLFVNLDNTLRKFSNHLAAAYQSNLKVPYPNISKICCKYDKEEVSLRVDVDEEQQSDLNITDSLKACSSFMRLIQTHQPDNKSAGSAIHRNEKACHQRGGGNRVGKNIKFDQKSVKSTLEAEMPASVLNCATKIQPHNLDNARSSVNLQNTIMHKEESTQTAEKLVLGEAITDFERAISLSHRPVQKCKKKQNVKFSRCTSGQVQTIQSSGNLKLEKSNGKNTAVSRANVYKKPASLSEKPTSKTVQCILKKAGHQKTNNPNLIGDTINIQARFTVSCDGNMNRLSPKEGEASMLQMALEAMTTVAGENCLQTSLAAASVPTHTQLPHSVDCAGNLQHSSCEKSDVSDDLAHQTLQIAGNHLLCSTNVLLPTKTLSHVSTLSHNSVNLEIEGFPKEHMESARIFSKLEVLQEDHFMDVALEIEVLENSETELTAEFAPMKQGHHPLLHDNDIAKHSSSLPQV